MVAAHTIEPREPVGATCTRTVQALKCQVQSNGISFDETKTVFLDPAQRLLFVAIPTAARTVSVSSVRVWRRAVKPMPIKNALPHDNDDLRPEYDLSKLTGATRGKYYERATAGTTLVLLDRDVADAFPDGETVNQALRALIKVANTQIHSARGKASTRRLRSQKRQSKSQKRPRSVRG